jgi:hypothetical protein
VACVRGGAAACAEGGETTEVVPSSEVRVVKRAQRHFARFAGLALSALAPMPCCTGLAGTAFLGFVLAWLAACVWSGKKNQLTVATPRCTVRQTGATPTARQAIDSWWRIDARCVANHRLQPPQDLRARAAYTLGKQVRVGVIVASCGNTPVGFALSRTKHAQARARVMGVPVRGRQDVAPGRA